MKLYMIRHGESEANINRSYAGWHDIPLTEKGKAQARELNRVLNDIHFDKVYTSDLIRAINTCCLALPDADYQKLDVLREINVGKMSGVCVQDELRLFCECASQNRKNYNFLPYGGEDKSALSERIREFLGILEKTDYENVAAFSHGAFIHIMFEVITGGSIHNISLCDNCSVSVFEYTENKWRLKAWNCRPQLIK